MLRVGESLVTSSRAEQTVQGLKKRTENAGERRRVNANSLALPESSSDRVDLVRKVLDVRDVSASPP